MKETAMTYEILPKPARVLPLAASLALFIPAAAAALPASGPISVVKAMTQSDPVASVNYIYPYGCNPYYRCCPVPYYPYYACPPAYVYGSPSVAFAFNNFAVD